MKKYNDEKFQKLRAEFPVFTYNGFIFDISKNKIHIRFHFSVGDTIQFSPQMKLELGKYAIEHIDSADLEGIIFHIGMIELISYWKATSSPTILIKHHSLSESQQLFWKKLYWKGLGEFFYQNAIKTDFDRFLNFEFEENAKLADLFTYKKTKDTDRVIVPIGGGKDSVVTLELLREKKEIVPFIINPRGATLDCAGMAGFNTENDIIVLRREIDRKLLELNAAGYLNGHTPFSAMLAFYSLLVSSCTGIRDIALSNEESANEPTIPGTDINHQYSKSLEFENDFRSYVARNMNDASNYFSFLRPVSELQIAFLFSKSPSYYPVFKSCNAGSKENIWCCNCSKCLFAYIILSPFIESAKLIAIFGENLLDKPSLQQYFDELTGIANTKPFECVGTIDEVNMAVSLIAEKENNTFLIRHYLQHRAALHFNRERLHEISDKHNLQTEYLAILKERTASLPVS